MRTLDRYIGAHVVRNVLLALVILLALFSFINVVDDMDSIGKGRYTFGRAFEHMLLTLPGLAFALFPVAAVVGSLTGLGLLAGNSELTVIRASGVSSARVTWSVMKAGAILMLIALMVGELLAPVCERLAEERRSLALSNHLALKTTYGFWIRDGNSFINIRRVLSDSRMEGIYIYEFDDAQQLRVATYAKGATYQDGAWTLSKIRQSELTEDGVLSRKVSMAGWDSLFDPELISVVSVKPESLSALGLYRYLGYLRENGLGTSRYEIALWSKFIYPAATGVMVFLALPLVLGQLRGAGLGHRILVGALLGIGFHIINKASVHMGVVFQVEPLLSATVPTLLFFALGLWLMKRAR